MARKKRAKGDLLRFLRERAVDRAVVDRAGETVALFMAIAEAGRYPLVRAAELDKSRCISAIRECLITVVDDVRFVSADPEGFGPGHRTSGAFIVHPARSLGANRRGDVEGVFEEQLIDEFSDLFWIELANPVIVALTKTHSDLLLALDDDLRGYVSAVPAMGLFYFLLYALLGKEDKIAEMEPFLRLVTEAIPIGEPWDAVGTWIVLTS